MGTGSEAGINRVLLDLKIVQNEELDQRQLSAVTAVFLILSLVVLGYLISSVLGG